MYSRHMPRKEPPCYPTFTNSFLPTKFDLLLVVDAAQAELLPFYPRRPKPWEPLVSNGSIIVCLHDESEELDDWDCWTFVDKDGIFEISQSKDSSGLMRKKASVLFDGKLIVVFSYYRPWDTTNGKLVPPSRSPCLEGICLRRSLAYRDDPHPYSPMEKFRVNMEALREFQSYFKQLVACLLFSSTDRSDHLTLLRRNKQLDFPHLHSNKDYWGELSTQPIFKGVSPDKLQRHTIYLLDLLLYLSDHGNTFPTLKPPRGLLPLQNLCLYFEAFGIEQLPLGAFRPLDETGLARALQASQLFSDNTNLQPQMMKQLDDHLRQILPIGCSRVEMELTPAFTGVFTLISATDQRKIRMGIEHLCEIFPRFRDLQYRDLLLLHQCILSSTDEETTSILESWMLRGKGRSIVFQVLKAFQEPLAPEVLGLVLADMLLLWALSPSSQMDACQSTPSNLRGLELLLSGRVTLKNSYRLLLDLHASFCNDTKVLEEEKSNAIMQLLEDCVCFIEGTCPSDKFTGYFSNRFEKYQKTAQMLKVCATPWPPFKRS